MQTDLLFTLNSTTQLSEANTHTQTQAQTQSLPPLFLDSMVCWCVYPAGSLHELAGLVVDRQQIDFIDHHMSCTVHVCSSHDTAVYTHARPLIFYLFAFFPCLLFSIISQTIPSYYLKPIYAFPSIFHFLFDLTYLYIFIYFVLFSFVSFVVVLAPNFSLSPPKANRGNFFLCFCFVRFYYSHQSDLSSHLHVSNVNHFAIVIEVANHSPSTSFA